MALFAPGGGGGGNNAGGEREGEPAQLDVFEAWYRCAS